MKMKLWSNVGRIEEVESRLQAEAIAREWAADFEDQKITLSWIDEAEIQRDDILFDGTDPVATEVWMEMMKQARWAL